MKSKPKHTLIKSFSKPKSITTQHTALCLGRPKPELRYYSLSHTQVRLQLREQQANDEDVSLVRSRERS